MSDKSPIQWTDATWNPTVGCSIVSPGCTNCYAMKVANGLERRFDSAKYRGLTKVVNGNPVWTGEVRLDEAALLQPLKWKKPRRIFVNSMSDLFHESLPDEAIDRVAAVMALSPQHTFQVLTKRAERMRAYFAEVMDDQKLGLNRFGITALATGLRGPAGSLPAWPLPNVWLGVSCERQQEAERIPYLLQTPAAVRFISAEPLLGPIDLCNIDAGSYGISALRSEDHPVLDWVIAGGESGGKARPMHPQWARDIRDQCAAAGVAYFFKQFGEHWPAEFIERGKDGEVWRTDPAGGRYWFFDEINIADPLKVRFSRVGKKKAGRLLDGREWNEFPRVA